MPSFGAVLLPRRGGKTTRLVEFWKRDPDHRAFVVMNHAMREHLMGVHHIPDKSIFTAGDVKDGALRGRHDIRDLLFDDFEHTLRGLVPGLDHGQGIVISATGVNLEVERHDPEPTPTAGPKRFKV